MAQPDCTWDHTYYWSVYAVSRTHQLRKLGTYTTKAEAMRVATELRIGKRESRDTSVARYIISGSWERP